MKEAYNFSRQNDLGPLLAGKEKFPDSPPRMMTDYNILRMIAPFSEL